MAVSGIKCDISYTDSTETKSKYSGNGSLNFKDVLKDYEEKTKLTADKLKEADDWRDISDEAWDKLLESIDNYIDFRKEMNREMVKRQLEAEQKAAGEAEAGMKTIAASQAALAVASCGFYGGIFTGGGESSLAEDIRENSSESDWTHIISTDDQVLLRKARMAQDTKVSVICEAEERKNGKITEYNSLDISAFVLQKEDKEAINQKLDFGCIK